MYSVMVSTSRTYLLVVILILTCISLHGQITSTFNSNAEGWTTPNDADATITYAAAGGNPGGLVAGSPFVIVLGATTLYVPFNFVAPGTYLGNRSSYYNGTLRYDIQQSTTGAPNQYAEVTIANSLGIVLYYFPTVPNQPAAAPTWTTFSVTLNNALGYWKTTNSATGLAATEAQVLNVLTDLANLEIRGLYRDANTTNRLDNVSFRPPIVITTQPTSSTICNGVTTTLITAATGNPTITYQWQFESSPTVWTNITNTGGYSGVTTATLSVNTTGNFGGGNYRCRISGLAVDDAITSTATITINPLPTAPTTTGSSSCTAASLTLTAAGGAAGQYRWYTVPTGGTAIAGQTNSTYTTPVIAVTTTYYAAINNGTCESTRTAVIATINTPPAAPTTTGSAACGTSSVTLSAAGGAAGQYRWYTVPTGGTAIAGQTNSTYTTPVIAVTTTYYAAINNGTCESTRTAVIATINTPPAAPTTTGSAACGTSSVTLSAAGGAAGQYRWYTVPTGGTAIAGQTNSTYATPLIAVTTTYYSAINNGTCESTRTAVIATINTPPTAPTTTGSASCVAASLTLTAAGGAAGQYRWYTVPTGGTAIAGQTNSTYITPVIAVTTTFYAAINNGICESTRTAVIASINTPPGAPTATGSAACGTSSVTLSAAGGAAGQYRWYTVPIGGTAIAGQTNSTYSTPVLTLTTTFYVAINNGTCESTRTAVVATINTPPGAPTTTGNAACGTASITLSATGGTPGQYRWYTVPTGGAPIAGQTNDIYTTPALTTTTTFYVAINNGTCESTRTSVTATINTLPLAPTATGNSSCLPGSVTLTASGGFAGEYRWYTVPTGGTAIAGQINNSYTTPVLTSTTTYYVAINNGICEGIRTSVTATIAAPGCDNEPPVIQPVPVSTQVGGLITLNLLSLISDSDDNIDFSTLTIVSPPSSGASASIDGGFNLIINYNGISFTGVENITIRVCDIFAACTDEVFSIEVIGDIEIYTGISPNNDEMNDVFIIQYIELLPETQNNKVSIFNRWGSMVFEVSNYNNTTNVFRGLNTNGSELPTGTYFYKIEFASGRKTETGYLTLKR